jgi:ammonium transporter, Amt family
VVLAGLGTAVIGIAIQKTVGFRVSHEAEISGVDRSEHAESAYDFADLGQSRFNPFGHPVSSPGTAPPPAQAADREPAAPAQRDGAASLV